MQRHQEGSEQWDEYVSALRMLAKFDSADCHRYLTGTYSPGDSGYRALEKDVKNPPPDPDDFTKMAIVLYAFISPNKTQQQWDTIFTALQGLKECTAIDKEEIEQLEKIFGITQQLLDSKVKPDPTPYFLNLNGGNFESANLAGLNLKSAFLREANLRSANLEDADLSNADLRGATLMGVKLNSNTRFEGARFFNTLISPSDWEDVEKLLNNLEQFPPEGDLSKHSLGRAVLFDLLKQCEDPLVLQKALHHPFLFNSGAFLGEDSYYKANDPRREVLLQAIADYLLSQCKDPATVYTAANQDFFYYNPALRTKLIERVDALAFPKQQIGPFVMKTLHQATPEDSFLHTVKKAETEEVNEKQQTTVATWYIKYEIDPRAAGSEASAQEFFRLLFSNHPETLHIEDEGRTYVASKEVAGKKLGTTKTAKQEFHDNLQSHTYHGLGGIMVAALWLNESDLRFHNMVLDKNNNLAKFDGGRCLRSERSTAGHDITPAKIKALPYYEWQEGTPHPDNWLDLWGSGIQEKDIEKSVCFSPDMQRDPVFRNEINEALFKICLLPPTLLEALINHQSKDPDQQRELLEIVTDRRNALITSAAENEDFYHYLFDGKTADDALKSFSGQLEAFQLAGSHKPLSSILPKDYSLRDDIASSHEAIKSLAMQKKEERDLEKRVAHKEKPDSVSVGHSQFGMFATHQPSASPPKPAPAVENTNKEPPAKEPSPRRPH